MTELVGSCCVHCGEEITGDLDGRFCSQCGQAVHTRCIRPPSPFAEYGCRECGIDSSEVERAAARHVAEVGPFPVAKGCPKCGSSSYKVVKPTTFIAFRWDRVCKACDTRYTPLTPMWAGVAFIIMGLILAVVGAASVFATLQRPEPASLPGMTCSGFLGFLGVLAVAHGVRTLLKPGRV